MTTGSLTEVICSLIGAARGSTEKISPLEKNNRITIEVSCDGKEKNPLACVLYKTKLTKALPQIRRSILTRNVCSVCWLTLAVESTAVEPS